MTGDEIVLSDCLGAINAELSANAKVLSESSTEDFKTSLERWTDLDYEIPGAIVLPNGRRHCKNSEFHTCTSPVPSDNVT